MSRKEGENQRDRQEERREYSVRKLKRIELKV
jgi:hypothetical protein